MDDKMNVCDFHEDWVKIVDKGIQDYNSLTAPERVWYNTQILLGQVGNGGLISYFIESTVEQVFETIEDLQLLGDKDIIPLLEKMCSLFPNECPPSDIKDREEIVGGWDEKYDQLLDKLDDEFFKHDSELEKALYQYIIENELASCKG